MSRTASKGVKLAGVHLEGPFINPKCLGAQNPDFVREPDIEMVKRLAGIFPVKKVSYAVEMPGGDKFAAECLAEGITPSCVHSAATFKQFQAAHEHGLQNLTHFCNQMTPLAPIATSDWSAPVRLQGCFHRTDLRQASYLSRYDFPDLFSEKRGKDPSSSRMRCARRECLTGNPRSADSP